MSKIDNELRNVFGNRCETIEDFNIDLIKIDMYDIRKTSRTPITIDTIAKSIKENGQWECVHIALIDNEHHLMAGYTRYHAMKSLGHSTIRAQIYKDLSNEEINAFVYGTNVIRFSLDPWEKIRHMAQYMISNPNLTVTSIADINRDNSKLTDIFDYGKSLIYELSGAYDFITKNEILFDYVENTPKLKQNIILAIHDCKDLITNNEESKIVIEYLKTDPRAIRTVVRDEIRNLLRPDSKINIQKKEWQLAQKILKNELNNIDGVKKVKSFTNRTKIGYDFEVIFENGEAYYVDCKKVDFVDEPFVLTPREWTVATLEGDKYIIGLVIFKKNDEYEIKYIQNLNPTDIEKEDIKVLTGIEISQYSKYIKEGIDFRLNDKE